ncbi:MAG TPA: Lacal_2735 family protein [Flavobacterium sp.]
MIGLLKEKNEIEKLQEEYKRLAETAFNVDADSKNEIPEQELTLEECES